MSFSIQIHSHAVENSRIWMCIRSLSPSRLPRHYEPARWALTISRRKTVDYQLLDIATPGVKFRRIVCPGSKINTDFVQIRRGKHFVPQVSPGHFHSGHPLMGLLSLQPIHYGRYRDISLFNTKFASVVSILLNLPCQIHFDPAPSD